MLSSLSWLPSLELRLKNNHMLPIRFLTNLTSLDLRYIAVDTVKGQKSFEDLRKIQKLTVPTHVLERGRTTHVSFLGAIDLLEDRK